MKRKVQILLEVNWEDYEDVSSELLLVDLLDGSEFPIGVVVVSAEEIESIPEETDKTLYP